MRRILTLGVAWAAAGVAAAVVAWQGVGLVGDQVTDERPATLTAADVEAALAATTTTTAGTAAPPTSTTTSTTAPPAPARELRTYEVTGGIAVLGFGPDGVTLESAAPATGYGVRWNPIDGGWRVEFEGPAGRSRIEGWWDGGPQDRVEDAATSNRGDDDDSGGGDDGDD